MPKVCDRTWHKENVSLKRSPDKQMSVRKEDIFCDEGRREHEITENIEKTLKEE